MDTSAFFGSEEVYQKLECGGTKAKIRHTPVVKPKESFWYIYHSDRESKKEGWRLDGYRWRQGGGKKMDIHSVVVQSRYFHAVDKYNKPTADFRRCAFTRSDKPEYVLIQYVGDACKATKHVMRSSRRRPLKLLENSGGCPNPKPAPRHPEAPPKRTVPLSVVEAAQKNARARIQFSDQVVRNLRTTMQEVDFISVLSFHKEILQESEERSSYVVIARLPALVDVFTEMAANRKLPPACLSLDASINFRSFYLSVLFFRENEFTDKPDLPLLFMLHDRKNCRRSFEHFWLETVQLFPFLDQKDSLHYFVIDWDEIVCQTFRATMPNCPKFYRWPSIFKETNKKLKELQVTSSEDNFYVDSLWRLFASKTVEEYEAKAEEIVKRWHAGFRAYYAKEIQPELESIGRWATLKRGMEATVLKRPPAWHQIMQKLQQWEDIPADSLVTVLYRVSEYFTVEVKRGRYGIGTHRLIPSETKKYDNGEAFLFEAAPNIDTLVGNVRSASESQFLARLKSVNKELTMNEQAKLFIDEGLIHLDTKTRTFTVHDVDAIHVVTLFPTVTCTCPGIEKCAHVIAAKLAIGVSCEPKISRKSTGNRSNNAHNEDDSSAVERQLGYSNTLLQAKVTVNETKTVPKAPPAKKQCIQHQSIVRDAQGKKIKAVAEEIMTSPPVWMRFNNWSLTMDAKNRIASGDILKSEEIQFAMQILQAKYPHLHGFQNPCPVSHTDGDNSSHFTPIPDGKHFVQILRTDNSNWACISNTLSHPTTIVVCDSLNVNGKPTKQVVTSIMALLKGWKLGKNSILQIEYLPIVKHQCEAETGPIAIACAEMLARSADPSNCLFQDVRSHLVTCFEKGVIELTQFPHLQLVGQHLIRSTSDSLHELPEIELQ